MSETKVIDGVAIELARHGDVGRGPTLVLLHEGLGSVSTWRDFPARVARSTGLPVLVSSRAGYGASDPVPLPRPLTYMHDEAARALPALLEAESIHDAILVGHSDGASIAILYAASAHGRARVRALVLLAPHVFVEDRTIASIERARDAYREGDLRARLERHHAHVDVAFWGWNGAWLDPGFRAWNIESALPHLRAPILAIQSSDDPYGTLAQLDAIERQSPVPFQRLVLDECGHAPHRDHPDEVLAAIARFVEALR